MDATAERPRHVHFAPIVPMRFQSRHRVLILPLFAALAHAGCSAEKNATGPEPVAVDSVPPIISFFLGPIEPVGLGGDIEIRFTVRDAVGVKQTILSAHGAFEGADTLEFSERPTAISITYSIPVPDEANVDAPVVFTLIVSDDAGHTKQGQTSVRLADLTPPLARIAFGGLHGDETIRTGEPLDVFVTAQDNHRLVYIGYEGGGLRDSVPATSRGDSHAFRLTVPPSWLAERPLLRAWARDASGLVSPLFDARKEVPVYNWVDRSIMNIPVELDGYPLDVLWDARRNIVYRLRLERDGTDNSRIDGVDVLTGASMTPISLPPYASTFTFSASRDSLVVMFGYVRSLGVVDLLPTQRSATMIPLLPYDGYESRGPLAAHASGGRFFVVLGQGFSPSRLLEVNFSTGAQVIRTDIDGASDVAPQPSLLRLPDGRLVIGPSEAYYPGDRVIYSPASNSFTITRRLRAIKATQYSASPSGRFMMANTVFGTTMDSLATVSTQDWGGDGPGGGELSADGLSVYTPTLYGYQKVRVSDGFLLEQVKLGMTPLRLFATVDGSRLVVVGESVVKVVDVR